MHLTKSPHTILKNDAGTSPYLHFLKISAFQGKIPPFHEIIPLRAPRQTVNLRNFSVNGYFRIWKMQNSAMTDFP